MNHLGKNKSFYVYEREERILYWLQELFNLKISDALRSALHNYWEPIIIAEMKRRGIDQPEEEAPT